MIKIENILVEIILTNNSYHRMINEWIILKSFYYIIVFSLKGLIINLYDYYEFILILIIINEIFFTIVFQ